jgi:hypothetical protein
LLHGTPGTGDATVFTGDPGADADRDGLTARMEYALGTSDSDGGGSAPLCWNASDGSVSLQRSPVADDAALILESSTDLASWSANWLLQRRDRTPDGRETLRFTPPPGASLRTYLRARLP